MPELLYRPEVINWVCEGNTACYRLHLPGTLAYFHGHFPNFPILPGVVQVHWAALLFLESSTLSLKFAGMENIKFKHLLLPRMYVDLQLDYNPSRLRLAFRYLTASGETSSGRIYWAQP